MAKKVSMIPLESSNILTENALIAFIRKERTEIIQKVKSAFPSLREEQIKDIFQDVCIALVEKAHKEDFRLTCSLFYFVYKCCWNKAEHETRGDKKKWTLPTDDILKDNEYEEQTVKQEKVDQLLDLFFEENSEKEDLLNQVCEVVKALPEPCDKILYGMYGTPKKKQDVIAKELGYSNSSVVKTMASRCKSKFRNKFKSIYEAYKRGL